MIIDWFTVVAQVVNFLVLVWLLRRFLYKPILSAIDAREKRIAKELADADAEMVEARKERSEFRQKNEELDQQRDALMEQAKAEAQAERRRLLDEARKAAEELHAKRQELLKAEAENLNQALSSRIRHEVFAIARKTLRDLAGASLEERLNEVLTRRLRDLDGKEKEALAAALQSASEPARVRSAFELQPEQRKSIQSALNETFGLEVPVRFETEPELVSGIELVTNGHKVAWSIADYLSSLETAVAEIINEKETPRPENGGRKAETEKA
ncbi:MAG TPA: F0F1 ATP synthase subunit B [Candidatus Aminicenantes bacterium]|nr:F0F1 ATP synthase subunit B [Candidatus Aminicenantes bacterium]